MKKNILALLLGVSILLDTSVIGYAQNKRDIGPSDTILSEINETIETINLEEDIEEEDRLGDMEMIAQLVQAEAGNQDLTGMRLVVDVVLNRSKSDKFPDSIVDIIYQKNQFEVISNGMFDKAAWMISDRAFEAVRLECEEGQMNTQVLYFSRDRHDFVQNHFKHQDHWFGW